MHKMKKCPICADIKLTVCRKKACKQRIENGMPESLFSPITEEEGECYHGRDSTTYTAPKLPQNDLHRKQNCRNENASVVELMEMDNYDGSGGSGSDSGDMEAMKLLKFVSF